MSLIAILSSGKHNSSAWLRDQLIADAWRAKANPTNIGVPTEYLPHGGRMEHPALDPVLRYHCRLADPDADE
jgi:hypothetical protein